MADPSDVRLQLGHPPSSVGTSRTSAPIPGRFQNWTQKRPLFSACIVLLGIATIVIVAVVPPVCIIKGCGPKRNEAPSPYGQANRLIVYYGEAVKTVRDRIPPALHQYLVETRLLSGIIVVSFKDSQYLDAVRSILEGESDLRVLLRDSMQMQLPLLDPWLERTSNGTGVLLDRPPQPPPPPVTPQTPPPLLPPPPGPSTREESPDNVTGATTPDLPPINWPPMFPDEPPAPPSSERRSVQQQQAAASAPLPPKPQVVNGAELGDALFGAQWSLGVLQARQAWNISQGAHVVVAVIDTGCDLGHPDLQSQLWVNKKEIPGNNIDDDGNGYVDDIHGYDFAGQCANDYPTEVCGPKPNPQDIESHGSHCAGILAAARNNGVGISGVAPEVRLMCLKVVPFDRAFYTAHILKAIDYAVNNGAHVISCSFGPDGPNLKPTPEDLDMMVNQTKLYSIALEKVKEKNILLVAAAGNENTDLDRLEPLGSVYNPCTLSKNFTDNVLCIMATNNLDQRLETYVRNQWQGTNYGVKSVDIAAPGLEILSTVPQDVNGQLWINKTGSSMATPMVAGVGALVMSVLATRTGNFYNGREARRILLESADRVANLPVRSSKRINAAAAVQQAYAQLDGVINMVPLPAVTTSSQTTIMPGFNEAYYSGVSDEELVSTQLDSSKLVDISSRATNISRFETYKRRSNVTVELSAFLNLSMSGLYLIKITTTGRFSDLWIQVGQVTLQGLNNTFLLKSVGGWYDFKLRYRNPSAFVSITIADPLAGGIPALGFMPLFCIATPVQPQTTLYSPGMVLSSAFQVLTRAAPDPSINTSPLLPAALNLDQGFTHSAVLDDLFFPSRTGLGDALYGSGSTDPNMRSVVGLAHTRLRAPGIPMRFKLNCTQCALYINDLLLLDVFSPVRSTGPVSQLSTCVTMAPTPNPAAAHVVMLRFAVANISNAPFMLSWLPCSATDNGDVSAVSVKSHIVSSLFWKPDSGVAGYVSGMQCDVWPRTDGPLTSEPLIKFRLPSALTQAGVEKVPFKVNSPNELAYRQLVATRCSANETASPGCNASMAFKLRDVVLDGGIINGDTDLMLVPEMRCWAYINRGFKNGIVSVNSITTGTDTIKVSLGSQAVYTASRSSLGNIPSRAPLNTNLNGYYQLLTLEWRKGIFSGFTEVFNGTVQDSYQDLDLSRTLLPIPIVTRVVGASNTPTTSRRPPTPSVSTQSSGAGAGTTQVFGSLYDTPMYSNSTAIVPQAGQALVARVTTLDDAYHSRSQILNRTVLYNASLAAVPLATTAGTTTCTALNGLSGTPCITALPASNKLTLPRYIRAEGFLRLPLLNGSVAGSASAGGGPFTDARWALRVRDTVDQVSAIHMGPVTVRSGPEFPASVTVTEVIITVPAAALNSVWVRGARGVEVYMPTVVTARSNRSAEQAVFDVAWVNTANGAATTVDQSLWYGTVGG